jgi:hypothetical protein
MNLVITSNRRRLVLDNEGANTEELWASLEIMAGNSSIQTVALRLERADAEKIAGFLEAWLHETEAPK